MSEWPARPSVPLVPPAGVKRRLLGWLGALLGLSDAESAARALLSAAGEPNAASGRVAALAAGLRSGGPGLDRALDDMLAVPATARHLAPRMLWQLAGAPADCEIIGLGSHCFTANLLRRWGARRWSGPFDWIFSGAAMVTHCIEDDFQVFLDRTHYGPVPPAERRDGIDVNRVQHLAYREMFGIEYVFNHHDAHLDGVHDYFVRCVERFRGALARPGPKLFVLARAKDSGPAGDLVALYQALARRTTNFELLVVEVPWSAPTRELVPAMETRRDEQGPIVCTFDSISAWRPLEFEDPLDEHVLMRLIASACPAGDGLRRLAPLPPSAPPAPAA